MSEEIARKHLAELNARILVTPINLNTLRGRETLGDKAGYMAHIERCQSQDYWNDKLWDARRVSIENELRLALISETRK